MRIISDEAAGCFYRRENFKLSNTEVKVNKERTIVEFLLHGNCIAKKTALCYTIDTCGWNTVTTRERLNALQGVRVQQKKGQLFLNDILWDGKEIVIRYFLENI